MTDGALQGPPVLPRGSGSGQGGGVTHDVSDSASPPRGFASGLRGRLPVGLARRLTAAFVGLVTVVLVVNGAINLVFSYEEATTAAVQVQAEKAQAAAKSAAPAAAAGAGDKVRTRDRCPRACS